MTNDEWTHPNPDEFIPLDEEEFEFVMQLASAAGAYRMPMESPQKQGISLLKEDGSITELRLTDIPENRMAMAVRDHFEGEPDRDQRFKSGMLRVMAFGEMASSPRLAEWVRKEEGEVHQVMIHAAARAPLTGKLRFDEDAFVKIVEELIATGRYEEPEDDPDV
jgi:hypothetical protein